MKLPLFVFLSLCVFLTSISGYNFAYAFFMSTAANNSNSFTAAEVFPTSVSTPSPTSDVTPTDNPTPSPSLGLTPTPSINEVTITPSPTPIIITTHLVISEVQIDGGTGNADQDFIELYNPTSIAIDLSGYRLVRRTGNGSSDTNIKSWTSLAIIPAHGFYLWANSSISAYPASIGADTSTSVDLTNSSTIALRQGPLDTGTLIDAAGWNNGATIVEGLPFASTPGANQSIERKAYSSSNDVSMMSGIDVNKGNGYDTNDNSTDFILRTTSQPQNTSSPTEIP